jgi:SARP family transcriptional regulator, regulator of embCAB operon
LEGRWVTEGTETIRVYLAGKVAIESGDRVIDEAALPGLQGRVVLAMLAAERERSLSHDELAEELWVEAPPAAWESGLKALISKVRTALAQVGLDGQAITGAFRLYQLKLPPGTWIDLEAAADALHRAETFARKERFDEAAGWALGARAIATRPFLEGANGPWVERRRAWLHDVYLRSLEVLAEVWIARGDPVLAVADTEEALRSEPFRESLSRLLMRAHAAAGNRAEALKVYERCAGLFVDELGVGPSPETEELYLEILRSM